MDTNISTNTTPEKFSYGESFKRLFGGIHFQFPQFQHDHPPVVNVNEIEEEQNTVGQKVADKVASGMGSWRFIIIQTTILALWAILNSVGWWIWKRDAFTRIVFCGLSQQCLDVAKHQVDMLFYQLYKGNSFVYLASDMGRLW